LQGTIVLFRFSDCVLDTDRRELERGAKSVPLGPQVFDLLVYLLQNRERVVSKSDLFSTIWHDRTVSESTLTSHINAARKAIGDSGESQGLIRTIARKGFRFVAPVTEESPLALPIPTPVLKDSLAPPDWASIAVVPFEVLGQSDETYVADGFVEDIITELSRFSELFVIARNSSFQYRGSTLDVRQVGQELGVRYVLEGSIRRDGNRLRITAQLIDAATGAHRWAERYDRTIDDLFALQDEIACTIASVLSIQINRAEADRALLKPPTTWETYDYFLRGNEALTRFLSRFTLADLGDARALLQRSIDLDPSYARPYAVLASSHIGAYLTGVNDEYLSQAALQRAFTLARTAVELEPSLPLAHAHLADVHLFRRDYDHALATWQRVFELNHNFTDFRYGQALNLAGKFDDGLAALKRHMRLDPFAPPAARIHLGLAHLAQKQYADALEAFREVVTLAPHLGRGRMLLASTYANMGLMSEAREQIAELLRIDPTCSAAQSTRPSFFRNPQEVAHILQGMLQAGLPP
jgi:adenylate cyclase